MSTRATFQAILAAGILMGLSGAARAAVLAHWSFDEAGGTTAADSTGTLNANGVLKTATASGGVNLDAPGVFGSGVDLDGAAGSYLTTPYIDGFHASDYSMAAWINQGDTGVNTVFADWRNTWAFRLYTQGGQLGFDQRSNNPYGNSMGGFHGSVPVGSWQHVAFVWDRGAKNGKLYVNGQLAGQATSTRTDVDVVDNNRDYHIGWKQDGGDTFNGGMDELWIVNESLSPTQVHNLMNYNTTTVPKRFALAHLSFDEAAGTSVADTERFGSPSTVRNPLATDQNLNAPGVFNASGPGASGGLRLSNGTDYVGVPRVDIAQTSLTIAAFVDPTAIQSGDEIFGDWSNPWQFRLYLNDDGSLHGDFRSDGPPTSNLFTLASAAGAIDTALGFQHVAVTWDRDANEAHLYVDGVIVASTSSSGSLLDLEDSGFHPEYQVGWKRDSGGGGKFEGLIDELWVFNTALGPNELNYLRTMNSNPLVPEPSSFMLAVLGLLGLLFGWRRR